MRLIDLFAGCGGLTEGFVSEGFTPVFAVEWEPAAAATYAENFGQHVVCADIAGIQSESLPEAEIVVGGPPCQGFSQLGTRNPDDPRNHLWREYARIVAWSQPVVFVLENVPLFLKSDQFGLLQSWTQPGQMLEGFALTWGVLNAADYGVPQRRRRAIVIGSRIGPPTLPPPSHAEPGRTRTIGTERVPECWVTLSEAIGDIYESYPNPSTAHLPTSRSLPNGIPGPFKAREIHLRRNPNEASLRRYRAVPPGGNRFDLPGDLMPACWAKKSTGTTDVMGRLEWDRPALTIRTEFYKPEKGRYLHPQYDPDDPERQINRPITHWEAARIQTFPDHFVWCGTKIEIARQIGNAVPPRLAAAIARHIRGSLLEA